jgi:hypothetical protein
MSSLVNDDERKAMRANWLLGSPRSFSSWTAFGFLFFAATAAFATTLLPFHLEDLTHESDRVVVGKIVTLSRMLDGKEHRGFTYVILTVAETWKGPQARSVTLKVLGGQAGEDPVKTRIPGAPSFVTGWNYLLFLTARPEEGGRFYNVTGWAQGKWEIDPAGRLRDGRSLWDLRKEIDRYLENPKPKKLGPVARQGMARAPGPARPSFKRIPAPRADKTKMRSIRYDEGAPARSVTLTPAERKKLGDTKTGGGE